MTERAALAVVPALGAVPAVYAALRLAEAWGAPELDPALVAPSPHVALFWRTGLSVTIALGCLGPLLRLAERAPLVSLRLCEVVLVAAGLLLVAQAVWVP